MKLSDIAVRALKAPSLKDFVVSLLPGQRNDGLSSISRAGVSINESNALSQITVFACVRVISETLASLPLMLYRRLPRGKERANDHELYRILHDQPNPEMDSMTLRETLMAHVLTWGNGYAQIIWDDYTHIKELRPLYPDRMWVTRDPETKQILYNYSPSGGGGPVTLPAYRVLHIHGLGFDGLVGYSPIAMMREAVGLAKATEQFGSTLFKNGVNASGIFTYPGKLGDDGRKNLKKSLKENSGLENAFDPMILEEGMKWTQITIPPEDAQFLETRKFQRGEIASFFHVPPHMIGDLDRATFSNIEEQALEFVVFTMRPWLVRWEQAMNLKLLTVAEQKDYFTEHLVDGLMRGNMAARSSAYATARQWGWLSANDIREMENMNPLPGKDGDTYLSPLNMTPADQLAAALNKPKA
jgi:HK97 family phage portal protein